MYTAKHCRSHPWSWLKATTPSLGCCFCVASLLQKDMHQRFIDVCLRMYQQHLGPSLCHCSAQLCLQECSQLLHCQQKASLGKHQSALQKCSEYVLFHKLILWDIDPWTGSQIMQEIQWINFIWTLKPPSCFMYRKYISRIKSIFAYLIRSSCIVSLKLILQH